MCIEATLVRDEGRENKAYVDTRGYWTIGIGHKGPEVVEGLVWTDEQVDAAFAADVQVATSACEQRLPWFFVLPGDGPTKGCVSALNARQAVLVCMAFQMGPRGLFGFVNTLAAVRDGHFDHAAELMRQSDWARQTPLRCLRMAHQMATGLWQVT